MFQKVNEWLAERGARYTREGDPNPIPTGAYYASSEAEEAYGGMREPAPEAETGPAPEENDPYGGRVPYRSQRDMQAEEDMRRQQVEQEMRRQQAAAQQQRTQTFNRQGQAPAAPGAQTAYRQPQSQPQQSGNVLPFPGMIRGPEGNLYAHVEYIVLLRNRNECTKVIEYIKANASVFLNMEFIANDSERQRCVDMLSGAAYTLGCRLSKISQRGIYLISSPSVYVVVDQAMQKYTSSPEAQGYARTEYDRYAAYSAPRQSYGYAAQPPQAQTYAQPVAGARTATGYTAPQGYGYTARTGAGYAQPNAGYAAQPGVYANAPRQQAPYAQPSYGAQGGSGAQPNYAAQTGYQAQPENGARPEAGYAYAAGPEEYRAQHAPRQTETEGAYPPAAAAEGNRAAAFGMGGAFTRNYEGATQR